LLANRSGSFAIFAAIRVSAVAVATSVAPAAWQSSQRSLALGSKRMGDRERDNHLGIMVVIYDDNFPCFRIIMANVKQYFMNKL
jgi:hypothetical protein